MEKSSFDFGRNGITGNEKYVEDKTEEFPCKAVSVVEKAQH
jgi:hypothetical protein